MVLCLLGLCECSSASLPLILDSFSLINHPVSVYLKCPTVDVWKGLTGYVPDRALGFSKHFLQMIRSVQLDWVNGVFCHYSITVPVVQFLDTFQCFSWRAVSRENLCIYCYLGGLSFSWQLAIVVYFKSTDDSDDLVVVLVVFNFFRVSFDSPYVVMISLILFQDFF